MKNTISKILSTDWYWAIIIVIMPAFIIEDTLIELLATKIYLWIVAISLSAKVVFRINMR